MRRLIALLLAATVAASQVAALASMPRHVNPADIPGEIPSPYELFALYSAIVDAAMGEDYAEAMAILRETFAVYAPEDIKYILERFHELLSGEISYLNETYVNIELARQLLDLGLLGDARLTIYSAAFALAKANVTLADLRVTSAQLSKRVPMPLGELLENLEALVWLYYARLFNLTELERLKREAIEVGLILETAISVNVSEREVWVGSSVAVFGNLTLVGGEPLPSRPVSVYLDGKLASSVVTDDAGFFNATVKIPYVYKPWATVYATFAPRGLDAGTLAPCKSNEVTIGLLYLTPNITVRPDRERALPTETFAVFGSVDVPSLAVWAEAFGETLETVADESGAFNFTFTVPEGASEGMYVIEVGTRASGVVAPSRTSTAIEVYRLPVDISVEAPRAVLAGFAVRVAGALTAPDGPLAGARVTVKGYGLAKSVVTDDAGRFEAELATSPLHHTGWYAVEVSIAPPPRYRPTSAKLRVLTLNPYLLFVPVALLLALAKGAKAVKGPKPPELEERALPRPPPRRRPTRRAGVPAIYHMAADLVSAVAGVPLKPSDTAREFLAKVRPALGSAADPFEKLTRMLEAELYGGVEQDVSEAERLLREIEARVRGVGL